MGKNNKNNFSNRETNVSTKVKADRTKTKVNGGVFVYTGAITAGELAKTINIPLGDVIKFLFLQGKMVTINTILDDELIGLVCLEFGYDFQKKVIVAAEHFEDVEINDDAFMPIETIIGSMTPYERRNPSCLNGSRKQRIASGSGSSSVAVTA